MRHFRTRHSIVTQKNDLLFPPLLLLTMTTPYYNAGGGPVVVQGHDVSSTAMDKASVYDHGGESENVHKNSPPPRQCRDVFWAIFFYLHLGAFLAVSIMYAPAMVQDLAEMDGYERRLTTGLSSIGFGGRFLEENADGDDEITVDPQALLVIVAAAGIIGLVISTIALAFMMNFAKGLIKVALWFNIIFFGALGLLSLVAGVIPMGLILVFMSAFSAYYAFCVWSRIPFAASNLVTAVSAVRQNMGLAFYAYVSLVFIFGWSIWWAVGTMATLYVTNGCNAEGECEEESNAAVAFLFFTSYYWVVQVISNVVHVTTAGTVGVWWFSPVEASGCCSKAVRQSYFRSITYSFGSICLGSLIVALIQAIKEMIHSARDNGDSVIACCAECLIGCIQALVEVRWKDSSYVLNRLDRFCFMPVLQLEGFNSNYLLLSLSAALYFISWAVL